MASINDLKSHPPFPHVYHTFEEMWIP